MGVGNFIHRPPLGAYLLIAHSLAVVSFPRLLYCLSPAVYSSTPSPTHETLHSITQALAGPG